MIGSWWRNSIVMFAMVLGPTAALFSTSHAQSISTSFSYQGRAFDTNGTSPLLRTVDVRVQIRSANGACLLYEEAHNSIDLAATQGYFSLKVGSPVGDSKRTGADPALSMSRIFSNLGQARATGANCAGGYTPLAGDKRRLRITIVDGGSSTTLTPDQDILSVPYATVAETLQGVSASGFIQVAGAITQQNVSDLLAKKAELLSLASNVAALTSLADGTSTTYLKSSGGGASFINAGDISLAQQKSLQLGSFTNSQQSTLLSSLGSGDKGKTWFNSDTNMIIYWDGASAKAIGTAAAITSLNGATSVSQSLAVAAVGTAPNWSTNTSTGVHTLNLPLASANGTTAGLLSYDEYAALANGADARFNPAFTAGDAGKFTRLNDAGTSYVLRTPAEVRADLGLGSAAAGDTSDYLVVGNALSEIANPVVAASARANLGLTTVGNAVATAASSASARTALGLGGAAVLDVGVGSGKVAAGDDSRITGALQQSVFDSYVAGVSGLNACTAGQMMYWNSVSNQFACATISIGANQIASGTIDASRLPAATGASSGIVTQAAQTFAGAKTFADDATFTGTVTIGGVTLSSVQLAAIQALGTINSAGAACTAGQKLSTDSTGNVLACVGGVWQISGGAAGSSPTTFAFTDQASLVLNSLTCSNVVTINGLNIPVYASVPKNGVGAPYLKVNGAGNSTTTYATVQSGDTLQVCATAANTNLGPIAVPVTVGSFTTTWNLTSGDAQPDSFTMGSSSPNPPTSVAWPVDTCLSGPVTGLTLPTTISVSADKGSVTSLNINNGGWVGYNANYTVSNNQSLCIRITTNLNPLDVHTVTVTLGQGIPGVTAQTATFTVTNPSQDTTPNAFNFTNATNLDLNTQTTSNTLTISGITGSVPVSVSGSGSPVVSINGGAWSSSGLIQNGQTLAVRMNSAATWGTTSGATVTVGTSNSTWSTTTATTYPTVNPSNPQSGVMRNLTYSGGQIKEVIATPGSYAIGDWQSTVVCGYVYTTTAGTYNLSTWADENGTLRFGDDANCTSPGATSTAISSTVTIAVRLNAGYTKFRIDAGNSFGGHGLGMTWTGVPGFGWFYTGANGND